MSADAGRAPQVRHMKMRLSGERGFSVLELLVIIVIVCVVIAIGVPTLHSRARAAVLDANMRTLASMVSSQVLEGYSTTFNPPVNGSADYYLNDHLAMALKTAGKASFVNPYVGSSQGHSIVNSDSLPADPLVKAPAVVVTNCANAQYDMFDSLPAASRRLLAGSLVVAFNSTAKTLDVFYVDGKGNKSPSVVSAPTG